MLKNQLIFNTEPVLTKLKLKSDNIIHLDDNESQGVDVNDDNDDNDDIGPNFKDSYLTHTIEVFFQNKDN